MCVCNHNYMCVCLCGWVSAALADGVCVGVGGVYNNMSDLFEFSFGRQATVG